MLSLTSEYLNGKVSNMSGPLEGCRVIELAHIMAGPVCGLMLADLGAEVIKVEKPEGDDTRRFLPPDIKGESAAYMMMNRNKRGIVLDLKNDKGREILLNLIKGADVLIENYRKNTMDKLGLGYEELKKENPGLIYAAISGFGRTGPYEDDGGFDLIAQGMSGLMSITGEGSDRPPVKVGAPVSDITAGIIAAMGISAAYARKLKTGFGQNIDTSLFEAGIVHTYWQSAIAFATDISPGPLGSAHPINAPYQSFKTSDGWVNVGAANQKNWEKFINLIGVERLQEDPRFSSNENRMNNRLELERELTGVMLTKTTNEWLHLFKSNGFPAGPVLSIKEMHGHPQTLARDMVTTVQHSTAGDIKTIGIPVKFSETPGDIRYAAPLLGQHTREVLIETGYSEEEIHSIFQSRAAIQHNHEPD